MGHIIYSGIAFLLSSSVTQEVCANMATIMDAVIRFLQTSDGARNVYLSMCGIAGGLVLVYFSLDIIGAAQTSMLTMERLMSGFVKMGATLALLAVLYPMMTYTLMAGKGLMLGVSSQISRFSETEEGDLIVFTTVSSNGLVKASGLHQDPDALPDQYKFSAKNIDTDFTWETQKSAFNARYNFGSTIKNMLWTFIRCAILWGIGVFTKLYVLFFTINMTGAMLLRFLMAPAAIANNFEGNANSQGMRYLKNTAGAILQFAVVALILGISDWLTHKALASEIKTIITLDNLPQVLTGSVFAKVIVAKVAGILGIQKTTSLIGDIMGTHQR